MLRSWCNNSIHLRLSKSTASICAFGMALLISVTSCRDRADEVSVKSDLIQHENQDGYRLVSLRNSLIFTVSFENNSLSQTRLFTDATNASYGRMSRDGLFAAVALCANSDELYAREFHACGKTILATIDIKQNDVKKFQDLGDPGTDMCWSRDASKLVLTVNRRRQGEADNEFGLQIMDLKTGQTQMLAEGPDYFVDPQCWSPDDKEIVYTANQPMGVQIVQLYNTLTGKSTALARGGHATWSPDGTRIAFLYCPPSLVGCSYYGLRLRDRKQELLFKADGETGLSWSPDSLFVSYITGARLFERKSSEWFREIRRLRVRRLADNAEQGFTYFYDGDVMWFDWVRSHP